MNRAASFRSVIQKPVCRIRFVASRTGSRIVGPPPEGRKGDRHSAQSDPLGGDRTATDRSAMEASPIKPSLREHGRKVPGARHKPGPSTSGPGQLVG